MNNEIIVSISCITFNHVDYIKEALNGFLMQETNFKYEVLIHDDASTDGTEEIIREYEAKHPDIIKPLYEKENQWVKGRRGSAVFNFPRVRGKYIALCEGDDYWTDPLKLQKQVDFLEENKECSLVFTGCEVHKNSGEKKTYSYSPAKIITPDKYLAQNNFAVTASLLFKKEVLKYYNEHWMLKSFASDFVLRYCALASGNIGCIPDITCIYNKGVTGSWSKRKLNKKIILKEYSDNMRGLYFLTKYREVKKKIIDYKKKELKQKVYFKYANSLGGIKGFGYLIFNVKNTSLFYIAAYLKKILIK